MSDIDHDIPHTDDPDVLADGVISRGKGGELVVMIDDIFGVEDTADIIFSRKAELTGSLRTHSDQISRTSEFFEIIERQRAFLIVDLDPAEVMDRGVFEDLGELLAQAIFHLVLIKVDPVLRESAGLDIAIEEENLNASLGELVGGVESCGACSNDGYDRAMGRRVFHATISP
jgi:hypothetical protein